MRKLSSTYRFKWGQTPIDTWGQTPIDRLTEPRLTDCNTDVYPQGKGASVPQVPVIHEVGHMLGLDHPGGRSNSPSAYNADPESLMGMGMTLRKSDFNKAFCSKIKDKDLNLARNEKCGPWKCQKTYFIPSPASDPK